MATGIIDTDLEWTVPVNRTDGRTNEVKDLQGSTDDIVFACKLLYPDWTSLVLVSVNPDFKQDK